MTSWIGQEEPVPHRALAERCAPRSLRPRSITTPTDSTRCGPTNHEDGPRRAGTVGGGGRDSEARVAADRFGAVAQRYDKSIAVDFPTMPDLHHDNDEHVVFDAVDDSVVADANPQALALAAL